MRISILAPLIGAALLCAGISAQADDNAAQAAARAALLQKMNELNTTQPQNAPTNSMPLPDNEAPAQPPATPPEFSEPPPAPAPIAVTKTNSPMPQTQSVVAPQVKMPPPIPPAPVQTQTTQIPIAPPTVGSDYVTTNTAVSVPMSSPSAQMPPTAKKPGFFGRILHPFHPSNSTSAVVQMEQPQPVKSDETVKQMGFTPIQAPPPPVSPEQEAQLHALLQRYEANQITPEEYQIERAAIIGAR